MGGKEIVFDDAAIRFVVPEAWELADNDDHVRFGPRDGRLQYHFFVPDGIDLGQPLKRPNLVDAVGDFISDLKFDDEETGDGFMNDIECWEGVGGAKREGKPVEFSAMVLYAGADPAILLRVNEPDTDIDKYADDLDLFLDSLVSLADEDSDTAFDDEDEEYEDEEYEDDDADADEADDEADDADADADGDEPFEDDGDDDKRG